MGPVLRNAAVHAASLAVLLAALCLSPVHALAAASNNVELSSSVYIYLEKLDGMGLIDSSIRGLRPITKTEAARLAREAEYNLDRLDAKDAGLAASMLKRLRVLLPREFRLSEEGVEAPFIDMHHLDGIRIRYVFVDGEPRSYNRMVPDQGGDGFFGIGHARPDFGKGNFIPQSGGEGTPLMENNEGRTYTGNHNAEYSASFELFITEWLAAYAMPMVSSTPVTRRSSPYVTVRLHKGYVKVGGASYELEAGRDALWFGQGYRGATVLTNNARPFDMIKLSSPEPLDWGWLREYAGEVKYAFGITRLSESGTGPDYRRPYLVFFKLGIKPAATFEIGINYARQFGGPNSGGSTAINGGNTVAGLDLRWRLDFLMGTTIYAEYMGEDNQGIIPFVESFLFGVYIPRLTPDGSDDLRFEGFIGNKIAYVNAEFPDGFTEDGLVLGHSQGGDVKDFSVKYTHHFGPRHRVAAEYIYTERGRLGRNGDEAVESKHAGRAYWDLPVYDDLDVSLMYGYERIRNLNLVDGRTGDNHVVRADLMYRY